MHRRLSRVVSTLAAIAATAGLHAADQIDLRTGRFNLRATVSSEEIHVEGGQIAKAAAARGAKADTRIVVAGGRAAASAKAKALLSTGEATRADVVLYLDGKVGDPNARVITTRRVLLQVADGEDAAALAAANGLRLTKPVHARPGWWIAEPLSADLYAAVDAAAALSADARVTMALPIMQMPVQAYFAPNDPVYTAGYQWHHGPFPGINVSEVWDTWKGTGVNVAITDTATQLTHPDLIGNARTLLSYDYFNNDADPNPVPGSVDDDHGTCVSGMAAATGDNGLGVAGVAFKAGIIAGKVLNAYDPNNNGGATLAPDDRMYDAITVQSSASNEGDLTWANNNSWGPGGGTKGGPLPLLLAGMEDATRYGRGGHGIPIIFACGNSGTPNPNASQNCSAFDGFLNRFTIGVAAISNYPAGHKASYSSTGPNIIISAPGGDRTNSRTGVLSPLAYGVVTTDRTGNDGYVRHTEVPLDSDFDLDDIVRPTSALLYENGDYVPPTFQLPGTSFAAPIVTGAVALMQQSRPALSWRDVRQLLIHRGQDLVPQLPPYVPTPPAPKPHDDWGYWRPNGANLNYNNWYGFGAVDMGRLVFGGDGTAANATAAGALNEPGALRWPLLPPMTSAPLTYSATFPLPVTGETTDPTALFDAPFDHYVLTAEVNKFAPDLVQDGRKYEGIGSRAVNLAMPITAAPERFRVDTVEVSVRIDGVATATYPASVWPRAGAGSSFYWTQYSFRLTSPSGATCILGRQREEGTAASLSKGGEYFSWTFSEAFHTNESMVNGTWTLSVIDEVNTLPNDITNDPDNWNPPEARVSSVGIKIYGHQTYAQPTLGGTTKTGLPSGSGDQVLELTGSGYAFSQAGLGVTQAYWYPDDLTTTPVELGTTVVNDGRVRVSVPASLLDTSTPGQGFVAIANPAVVVGRTGITGTAADAFDDPNPTSPMPSALPYTPSRYMKRCTDGETKQIRYSRPPTLILTPSADIIMKGQGTVSITAIASDPDVIAGLPTSSPETLTVTATSFNPAFASDPVVTLIGTPTGNDTYAVSVTTNTSNSGFALIQVSATDGVTTTVKSIRVIIPTEEDGSGCGGGMGLALLTVPLGVWLIRRRKRG